MLGGIICKARAVYHTTQELKQYAAPGQCAAFGIFEASMMSNAAPRHNDGPSNAHAEARALRKLIDTGSACYADQNGA